MNKTNCLLSFPDVMAFLAIAVGFSLSGCQNKPDEPKKESKPSANVNSEVNRRSENSILSWNIESGGAVASEVKPVLDRHVSETGATIVVLQEVSAKDFDAVTIAGWQRLTSESGRDDRLMMQFDPSVFRLLESREPTELAGIVVNPGNHRSPQMALLETLDKSATFWVVNVHQARGDENLRNQQAVALREWARSEGFPVVLIGDLNMDFDFPTQRGNASFSELIKDNVFQWVKPDPLIDTNWSDRNGDGVDDYPDSLLDGAFVAKGATEWKSNCRVIVTEGDFPDNEKTSDHRPILFQWSK